MAQSKKEAPRQLPSHTLLDAVKQRVPATIKVMVCRKWDVISRFGQHFSSDFIVSDEKGNICHCTAKGTTGHYFIAKLQEGMIYYIRNFKLQQNVPEYRVLRDHDHMIQFDGSTIVSKADGESIGFTRYPFQLVEFENLEFSKSKYLADVIGGVKSVGRQYQNQTETSNIRSLDLHIVNERGKSVKATLWGSLGDAFLKRWQRSSVYALILTSMNVKIFMGELCLSSTSATSLFDEDVIPILKQFKDQIKNVDLNMLNSSTNGMKEATISELLDWGRDKKNEVQRFRCTATVTDIRAENGWYYLSCNSGRCKKGVKRRDGQFFCESCEESVEYPKARFKIQLEVEDDSGHVVVVVFDDEAEKIVRVSAQSLLDISYEGDNTESVLPPSISKLINATIIFELRSNTHFQHARYESFTCNKIEVPNKDEAVVENTPPADISSSLNQNQTKRMLKHTPTTPEPKSKKRIKHYSEDYGGSK